MTRLKLVTLALALTLSACTTTQSPPSASDFLTQAQSDAFISKANAQFNLDPSEVSAALAEVQYQPKIITIMNRRFEAQPWAVYRAHMLTDGRIEKGRAFAKTNQAILQEARRQYGVSPDVVVAIIGVETMYGTNQGNYSVLDALATLSFAYPKRSAFFQSELANYLVICQQNHWPVRRLKGSYAGAFGIGQFMPSSYRQYAVSATEQSPDISNKPSDAILSVAHYFKGHGWQEGGPIAIKVAVPASLSSLAAPKLTKPKHTLSYWRDQGIVIPKNLTDLSLKAELVVELNAQGQREGWLIFHNFYVIARYNPSLNYSLSVYCLADALKLSR